jgi:hypothetical protein
MMRPPTVEHDTVRNLAFVLLAVLCLVSVFSRLWLLL